MGIGEALACTGDGHDCSISKCCAKEGNKCYRKNARWASCNETCQSNKEWEGPHGHGHWKMTNNHVWDCTDLTITHPTRAPAAPLALVHQSEVSESPPATSPVADPDARVNWIGAHQTPVSISPPATPSVTAA